MYVYHQSIKNTSYINSISLISTNLHSTLLGLEIRSMLGLRLRLCLGQYTETGHFHSDFCCNILVHYSYLVSFMHLVRNPSYVEMVLEEPKGKICMSVLKKEKVVCGLQCFSRSLCDGQLTLIIYCGFGMSLKLISWHLTLDEEESYMITYQNRNWME